MASTGKTSKVKCHKCTGLGHYAKVTRSVHVHFSIAAYDDYVECDVVPMQAWALLLGRPWQFDRNFVHHGATNQYTFVHDDKPIVLLPMSPESILKDDLARASRTHTE
jgi:hypothetical protein